VRKGEHGSLVVYADRITKTEQNEAGEEIEHEIPYLRAIVQGLGEAAKTHGI
jgi:antirestriction protein ArdC